MEQFLLKSSSTLIYFIHLLVFSQVCSLHLTSIVQQNKFLKEKHVDVENKVLC